MNRITQFCLATLTAAALAGCASTGNPNASAEMQCGYLARSEGLKLHQVDGVQSNANGVIALNVRVEDALGRRVNAVCNYTAASNSASWARPLPSGLTRG